MDERQRQVEIGAGLQESRINTELIEWLQKWGPRFLYVLLVIVLAYLGWMRLGEWRQRQIDQAYAEYEAEAYAGNPDVLLTIAKAHDGKQTIWTQATLKAASILLDSGRIGLAPAADLQSPDPADVLTQEIIDTQMSRSRELYQSVLDRNGSRADRVPFALEARWGLASVALSTGDRQEAVRQLDSYIEQADRHGFGIQAGIARNRIETFDRLAQAPRVYPESELPDSAKAPAAFQPSSSSSSSTFDLTGGSGGFVQPQNSDSSIEVRKIDLSSIGNTDDELDTPDTSPESETTEDAPEAESPEADPSEPDTDSQ